MHLLTSNESKSFEFIFFAKLLPIMTKANTNQSIFQFKQIYIQE